MEESLLELTTQAGKVGNQQTEAMKSKINELKTEVKALKAELSAAKAQESVETVDLTSNKGTRKRSGHAAASSKYQMF